MLSQAINQLLKRRTSVSPIPAPGQAVPQPQPVQPQPGGSKKDWYNPSDVNSREGINPPRNPIDRPAPPVQQLPIQRNHLGANALGEEKIGDTSRYLNILKKMRGGF